jgi:hypothetical protein
VFHFGGPHRKKIYLANNYGSPYRSDRANPIYFLWNMDLVRKHRVAIKAFARALRTKAMHQIGERTGTGRRSGLLH